MTANSGRLTTARVEGSTCRIPELWLLGMQCRGYTVLEAVTHWIGQEKAEREFQRQRAG